MKINLDFNLKDLSGVDIPNAHAGQNVAQALASANEGNSIKLFDWATKLYNKQTLEIDDTDVTVLKAFVENTKFLTNLAKGQLLEFLEKLTKNKK